MPSVNVTYWLLNGVINLATDPLHARIYYDPWLGSKDYIRYVINPRSDAIVLPTRFWNFNDPLGDGSGPGWELYADGFPTNFLFGNYNPAQAGGHTVVVYNPVNQVIVAARPLAYYTLEGNAGSYARILHEIPFISWPELGGADRHPYNAIAMGLAGQINWTGDTYIVALLDNTVVLDRPTVKYTTSIYSIPFSAIKAERIIPGCEVNSFGLAKSSVIKFDGIASGLTIASFAVYKQSTGEIIVLEGVYGGPVTTIGTNPFWLAPIRFIIGQ